MKVPDRQFWICWRWYRFNPLLPLIGIVISLLPVTGILIHTYVSCHSIRRRYFKVYTFIVIIKETCLDGYFSDLFLSKWFGSFVGSYQVLTKYACGHKRALDVIKANRQTAWNVLITRGLNLWRHFLWHLPYIACQHVPIDIIVALPLG